MTDITELLERRAEQGKSILTEKHSEYCYSILVTAARIGTVLTVASRVLLCSWVFHGLGECLQSIPMFQIDPTPLTISEFWLRHASQVKKTALGRLRRQFLCTCSQKFRIRADPLRAYGSFRSG